MQATHQIAPTNVGDKLQKLLPLLGSDKPGEIVATASAIGRILTSIGHDWHWLTARLTTAPSLVPAEPHWRDLARECICSEWRLRPKDREFLHALLRFEQPSERQLKWLHDIADRVRS